jgi:hypothetical protein
LTRTLGQYPRSHYADLQGVLDAFRDVRAQVLVFDEGAR